MVGWGVADFLAARSVRNIGNFLTLFWMQSIGFIGALMYFIFNFSSFDFQEIPRFIPTIAFFAILQTAGYLFFYKGFERGQISLVSPLAASWAMVTVLLSVIFFKEVLTLQHIIAIVFILFGIFGISVDPKTIFTLMYTPFLKGTKEGLLAMILWGISFFVIVPVSQEVGWFLPIFLYRLFAIIFLWIYIFITPLTFKVSFQPSLLSRLIPIGILDITAFFAYSLGVRSINASLVAPVAASFPLVTILLARIFLKEKILFNQAVGIAAVIAGVILIVGRE